MHSVLQQFSTANRRNQVGPRNVRWMGIPDRIVERAIIIKESGDDSKRQYSEDRFQSQFSNVAPKSE